jgi:hypothetical protein
MGITKASLCIGASAVFVLACAASSSDEIAADAPSLEGAVPMAALPDSDGDGVPDEIEKRVASEYLPFVSLHKNDSCTTRGIVFRAAKHPRNAGKLQVWGVVVYDRDCGANGHHGDDEGFGVVVDPTKRGAAGILAVKTISHQNTPCESKATCGVCPGMNRCTTVTTAGGAYPVIFSSKNKHGNYVSESKCDGSFFCDSGGCELRTAAELQSTGIPIVNVGEPTHPLVTNLTTQGFITAANGWRSTELFDYDPWHPGDFGSAGDLSKDFVDDAFVIDAASCGSGQ